MTKLNMIIPFDSASKDPDQMNSFINTADRYGAIQLKEIYEVIGQYMKEIVLHDFNITESSNLDAKNNNKQLNLLYPCEKSRDEYEEESNDLKYACEQHLAVVNLCIETMEKDIIELENDTKLLKISNGETESSISELNQAAQIIQSEMNKVILKCNEKTENSAGQLPTKSNERSNVSSDSVSLVIFYLVQFALMSLI